MNSINLLYLFIGEVDGYVEEKNGYKYLIFASTKNKGVLKKHTKLWDKIKSLIEKINDKPAEYGKDFMKIKLNSNDNLPLNKTLKLHI